MLLDINVLRAHVIMNLMHGWSLFLGDHPDPAKYYYILVQVNILGKYIPQSFTVLVKYAELLKTGLFNI